MSAARMAGSAVREFLRYGLGDDALGVAMRFAPDVGIGLITAATAPEGYFESPWEKLAYGAEQVAVGALPGAFLGGTAGTLARRMFKADPDTARGIAGVADMVGSFAVPTLAYATNTAPVSRYLNERAEKNAKLQAEMDRKGAFEAGLQAAAGGLAQSPYIQGTDQLINQFYG